MLKRNSLNFLTDLITASVCVAMILTGLTLRWVLPPGSRGGSGRLLWGLDRHGWGDIHFWLSIGLLTLLLVHVALHWQWVCTTALRCVPRASANAGEIKAGRRNVLGAGVAAVLIVLLSGFVWLARANVTPAAGGERRSAIDPQSEHAPGSAEIRGSMTHGGRCTRDVRR